MGLTALIGIVSGRLFSSLWLRGEPLFVFMPLAPTIGRRRGASCLSDVQREAPERSQSPVIIGERPR
jgi:hypothetical protein